MEETELQRFNRLCEEVGITTVTMNFFVKPDKLYNFFRAVIKDCNKSENINITKKSVKISTKKATIKREIKSFIFIDSQNNIMRAIGSASMTTREISEKTGLAIRTVQQHTKILGEKKILLKIEETNKWLKNDRRE